MTTTARFVIVLCCSTTGRARWISKQKREYVFGERQRVTFFQGVHFETFSFNPCSLWRYFRLRCYNCHPSQDFVDPRKHYFGNHRNSVFTYNLIMVRIFPVRLLRRVHSNSAPRRHAFRKSTRTKRSQCPIYPIYSCNSSS